jgi:malonate decarboxylase epsilon subunit
MNTALLFPGQGSQYEGMLHALIDDPIVHAALDEISDAVGQQIRALDSVEALRSTVSVQLALLAAGVATARVLIDRGVEPLAVAGLSVGAYAAAVTAEVLSVSDAARLVQSRAKQMEQLYPQGYGLGAIVGFDERQVQGLIADGERDNVFIANINAPRQIVIAGALTSLQRVLDDASRHGARKAELLPVAVPSHCPLLNTVAYSLREQIASITICDPQYIYISNANGRALRSGVKVAADLSDNIAHTVRWHDATSIACELGCELFLEMPPGHVLSDLVSENLSGTHALAVTPATFKRGLILANQSS